MKEAEQCVLCVSIQQKYSKLDSAVRDSDTCSRMIVKNKGMLIIEFRIVILRLKGVRCVRHIRLERMEIQAGDISFLLPLCYL